VALEFLCRKLGMTRLFDETGRCLAVTVLDATPNAVVQKKTPQNDGYSAVQLGMGTRARKNVPRPLLQHFEKAGVPPAAVLSESRLADEDATNYEVGQEIRVDVFSAGERVDVIATSKGRGTAGVVKRHGFPVHTESHGTHEFFRHGGSIGAGSFPGRVIKGVRMAGRHGNSRVTTRNLEVVRVDAEKNLLFVRGAVPGHNQGVVRVRPAVARRA